MIYENNKQIKKIDKSIKMNVYKLPVYFYTLFNKKDILIHLNNIAFCVCVRDASVDLAEILRELTVKSQTTTLKLL